MSAARLDSVAALTGDSSRLLHECGDLELTRKAKHVHD